MTTTTKYQVTLESADYDAEVFEYESLGEALTGQDRLVKSACDYGNADQIKRDITLQIIKTVRPTSC